jgi:hypothetical protein
VRVAGPGDTPRRLEDRHVPSTIKRLVQARTSRLHSGNSNAGATQMGAWSSSEWFRDTKRQHQDVASMSSPPGLGRSLILGGVAGVEEKARGEGEGGCDGGGTEVGSCGERRGQKVGVQQEEWKQGGVRGTEAERNRRISDGGRFRVAKARGEDGGELEMEDGGGESVDVLFRSHDTLLEVWKSPGACSDRSN